MTRVLLTGGSGFLAGHVLSILLEQGYSVVTTVRSQSKADQIAQAYKNYGRDKLDFTIVEDLASSNAFDHAVVSDPPFDAVIHTASPYHFNVQDTKKDLLDPAIIGTSGLLNAIKTSAPSVKHVVITSSVAAIMDFDLGDRPGYVYSELDWNPVTEAQAYQNARKGYQASKTFAERAAWDFLQLQKPEFTITTINPPMIFGPVAPYANLESINTSSLRFRNLIAGAWKDKLEPTGLALWCDVRDVALGHIRALEIPDAANKRFFLTAGHYSNAEMARIIEKHFPEYASNIPHDKSTGEIAKEIYGYDNSRSIKILGMTYRGFEESTTDLVKSLKAIGA